MNEKRDVTRAWLARHHCHVLDDGVVDQLMIARASKLNVCIIGETGTGKTSLAKLLADDSIGAGGIVFQVYPFGAGVEDDLKRLKSELEAKSRPVVLLLDGIEEIPNKAQALAMGAVPRGSRVIVTARRPKEHWTDAMSTVRYSFSLEVTLPPVRDLGPKVADLAELVLLDLLRGSKPAESRVLSEDARARLSSHSWPGNILELISCLQGALQWSRGRKTIEASDLRSLPSGKASPASAQEPAEIAPPPSPTLGVAITWLLTSFPDLSMKDMLEQVERMCIVLALQHTHWNRSQAAKDLGISRSNLIAKIDWYGLKEP